MAEERAAQDHRRAGFGLSAARLAIVKRAKAIALLPIVSALLTLAIVAAIPDRYTASSVIEIDPRVEQLALPDPTSAPNPAAREGERLAVEKQIKVLRAPELIDQVAAKLHLTADPEFQTRPLLSRLTSLFEKASAETVTREAFAARLKTVRVRSSAMISVRFTASDADKARRIADALVAAYVDRTPGASLDRAVNAPGKAPTASERVFASLVEQYGFARALSGTRVVEQASLPAQPAGPKRLRIAAISGFTTFGLVLAIAVLLERSAFQRTRTVEKTLACPHMTSIPAMSPDDSAHMSARSARLIVAEPACRYAEAVRNACAALAERTDGEASRVILVASALPGEGAEQFASNIAHHFAVDGQKALLIDCDFQTKALTQQLAPQASLGLLDQIATHTPVENAILRDSLTGIHFLPASGPSPLTLSVPAALRSLGCAAAFHDLKTRFPTIVLAAPPLLNTTDASALAELADQIVFLTAWHRTPHDTAKRALALLDANQRKVVGAVLTDMSDDHDPGLMSFSAMFKEIRRATRLPSLERAA